MAEQRKEAVNSQASEYLMTPANVQGNMTVIKRPNSVGVPIQHISVVDDLGHEIDDLLEERFQEVQVNAIGDRSSAVRTRSQKPDSWKGAKETFRQRAAAEEKLARPKAKRPSAYIPHESTEPIEDMEVDEEAVGPGFRMDREASEDTIQVELPSQVKRTIKPTVRFPKMSKGIKGIIETMKNKHPVLALKAQFQSEMAYWAEFF